MIVNSKLYFMFDSYQDRDRCVLNGLMLIILKALHMESTTFWKSKEWQKQVIRLGRGLLLNKYADKRIEYIFLLYGIGNSTLPSKLYTKSFSAATL